jgi:serine/threonine-protein kinase HipA
MHEFRYTDIRRRTQSRFGTDGTGPFALLSEIGRDCVGAVQLTPEDEHPAEIRHIQYSPLSNHEIAEALRNTTLTRPLLFHEQDFRISIAGAQEKTAFLWYENCWCRPIGTTPTTHIFKLPLGISGNGRIDLTTSIENEWLCSRIKQGKCADLIDKP